jgi:hypothetical protein
MIRPLAALAVILLLAAPADAQQARQTENRSAYDPNYDAQRVISVPGALTGAPTIYTGQVTSSATAAPLPTKVLFNGVVLTNDPASSTDVFVCPAASCTTAVGYKLTPGQSISFGVSNASAISSVTAAGTSTLFLAGN